MIQRVKPFASVLIAVILTSVFALAQKPTDDKESKDKKPEAAPAATPAQNDPNKPLTAEQIVDGVLFVYGFGGGRATLNQIRKTTVENGKTTFTAADGKVDQANYQRAIIRADTLMAEKIRLDQEFSNARYALVFNDAKVFGIYNNSVFTPREDAVKGFENTIFHGIEALLRYKENESKIEFAGKDKQLGVEYYMIDVTDKLERKTRYYLSVKSFRVMMLTYEDGGVKFRRKFYDQKYAQGTLVPYRSVLFADNKVIEESQISSITFGQKIDEELFKAG